MSARWGYNEDGSLDELVARNVRYLHFEDMGDGDWWMAVELENGELWHLNFGTPPCANLRTRRTGGTDGRGGSTAARSRF